METNNLPLKQKEVVVKLNESIARVLGSSTVSGFEKAFVVASAIDELKLSLTPEFMKPIMALQGNKLGFKTDRDLNKEGGKGTGYPQEVVKDCLIEAVLIGLQPCGNQFNIIAGNMYPTKEGFGYLLKNIPGLTYEIIPGLPRVNADKTSAAAMMKITWSIGGKSEVRDIEFPIKMNAYMGTDAVIGKATRKARAWLFNTIMNTEITDGDVTDIPHVDLTKEEKQDLYNQRLKDQAELKEKKPAVGEQTKLV